MLFQHFSYHVAQLFRESSILDYILLLSFTLSRFHKSSSTLLQ